MITDNLYRFNSWANDRVLALCEELPDSQLDEPREMGLGSLRNTMFHILTAEEIWLERWTAVPWRPFSTDAGGLPMREIGQRLERTAKAREALIERERPDGWKRICEYKNSKGITYRDRLDGLLLHVANHGIYHRAQALNYLKHFGRTVPGGLDFIFYRLAKPSIALDLAAVEAMRKFGLEVATGSSSPVEWDAAVIRNYFAYGDWCNALLLDRAAPLDAAALDRAFDMGLGTMRKTALHIADAERWWLKNWTAGPSQFDKAPTTTGIAELRSRWLEIVAERNKFIDSLDAKSAQRVVTALIGQLSIGLPVIESLVQLCGHGTHHRAQLVNMLRHNGVTAPETDYVVWQRQSAA
jgi:uncharacterized damage-inducible protein DinB